MNLKRLHYTLSTSLLNIPHINNPISSFSDIAPTILPNNIIKKKFFWAAMLFIYIYKHGFTFFVLL